VGGKKRRSSSTPPLQRKLINNAARIERTSEKRKDKSNQMQSMTGNPSTFDGFS
jgi:hypothetical protein